MDVLAVDLVQARIMDVVRTSPEDTPGAPSVNRSLRNPGKRRQRQKEAKTLSTHALIVNHTGETRSRSEVAGNVENQLRSIGSVSVDATMAALAFTRPSREFSSDAVGSG
jgi:hypothetical protein